MLGHPEGQGLFANLVLCHSSVLRAPAPLQLFWELPLCQGCPKRDPGQSLELLSLAVVPAAGGWRVREGGCAGAACRG